ncbi:hypothetical protein Hypma_002559 [Hypsizygus marmoreus]|uniref:Cyanovirin-N domain-containing protein n=1 Tax=Hypsizygus marmoreus TaxID=39966 RepID=A0A369J5P3_HYPMA|nr:hypothetical protein Hypma_002559 [Hypsizygus marmoreus]
MIMPFSFSMLTTFCTIALVAVSSTSAAATVQPTITPGNRTAKADIALRGFAQSCSNWGGAFGNAGGHAIAILQATCRTISGGTKSTAINLNDCIGNDGNVHCRLQ